MKKCIVLVMLSILILSTSIVTAFGYSKASANLCGPVRATGYALLETFWGDGYMDWPLVVDPSQQNLESGATVTISMDNLNDLVYRCNAYGMTTRLYEYRDGWYCAVIERTFFFTGSTLLLTWGNNDGYAYIAKEEQYNINVPSVDMSNTNSILASIYNAFYSYSHAQNETLYALYNKFAAYSSAQNGLLASVAGELTSIGDYLVSVLNDYFYPLVYNIDANIDSMELMLSGIGTTLDQMYRRLLVINNDIELNTDAMSTTLTEIKTLLETGIPVTGVDIGDVTVSTDLTNVEGYIDTVETRLTNIQGVLQRGLIAPSTQPYLSVILSDVAGLETTLSSILTELQDDTSTDVSTDLTNVEGYIDTVETKLQTINNTINSQLRTPLSVQLPFGTVVYNELHNANGWLDDIYTRLESIEDAVLDAENTIIDITTDNDAFNIFYVEKTDGTTESVGVVTKDAAKVAGEFLSIFYRLVFEDAFSNVDIMHDFEDVYTVTDSGVSVW